MTETEQRSLILRDRYNLTVPERFLIKRGLLLSDFLGKKDRIGKTPSAVNLTKEDLTQAERLKHAIALEKMDDYKGMLNWCLKWTESDPKNVVAWNNLGIAYIHLECYDEAIEASRQALHINLKDGGAWNNLGIAYVELKRSDDAIKAYRQALQIDPKDATVWNNIGVAYDDLNCCGDAIQAYRKAVRIDPEDANGWFVLGEAYYWNTDQTDKAIKAFRNTVRINPEYADAWFSLGRAYDQSDQTNKAIKAYQQVVRINPEYADAWKRIVSPGSGKVFDNGQLLVRRIKKDMATRKR
jgi:tetratricopeptide (TPR) repeat protein